MAIEIHRCVGWRTRIPHPRFVEKIESDRRQRWLYFASKRVLDVLVAALALILLAPVMLVIALLVRLDSPGPALFRQERVGGGGRDDQREVWENHTFTFYKFRSMEDDADVDIHRAFVKAFIHDDRESMDVVQHRCDNPVTESSRTFAQAFVGNNGKQTSTPESEDGQINKLVDDPRVTRFGKFLRKTSLDELPQLWNVLKGDMSLVGPRPPIPYEVEEYEPWHLRRLEARPGVTGLWQTMARSSVDFDEMVRLDIQYLEHQSFWLDLEILLRTPLAVLRGDGAM